MKLNRRGGNQYFVRKIRRIKKVEGKTNGVRKEHKRERRNIEMRKEIK